jgi:hypothetical protein
MEEGDLAPTPVEAPPHGLSINQYCVATDIPTNLLKQACNQPEEATSEVLDANS